MGLRKNPRDVPVLADYLMNAKIEDTPHVRTVVWALGECSRGGGAPPAVMEFLLGLARGDTTGVGVECLLAADKAGSQEVPSIVLMRLEDVARRAHWIEWSRSYEERGYFWREEAIKSEVYELGKWLHEHPEAEVQAEYRRFVARQIDHLAEAVAGAPDDRDRYGLFSDTSNWLLKEALRLKDPSFVAPLSRLRQSMADYRGPIKESGYAGDKTFVEVISAVCGDTTSKEALLDRMRFEFPALEKEFQDIEPEALLRDGSNREVFERFSTGFNPLGGPFNHESGLALQVACHYFSDAMCQEMAVALLDTPELGEYCTFCLLSWLTNPEPAHVARLRILWSNALTQGPPPNVSAFLAIRLAQIWKNVALEQWMFSEAPRLDLKEECLVAMARTDLPLATRTLDELAPVWNEEFSAANHYFPAPYKREDAFQQGRRRNLREALSEALGDETFEAAYRRLCGDKGLHPATRYWLLSNLPETERGPALPWRGVLTEHLFAEVASGVSQADYEGLVQLLGSAHCTRRLISEWRTADETWRRNVLAEVLAKPYSPEAAEVFDTMLRNDWCKDYKAVGDDGYDDYLERLKNLLNPWWSDAVYCLMMGRVMRDETVDVGYRACLAVCTRTQTSLEDLKKIAAAELPDEVRAVLESEIEKMEESQRRLEELRTRREEQQPKREHALAESPQGTVRTPRAERDLTAARSWFAYRLAAGLSVLAVLLALDLRRGRTQRLKEYAFLFGVAVAAMAYGVAHDYVSWSICRDYFVAGKGIPSAASHYSWEVMKHAMGVSWTVGLLGAAFLLIANNRDKLGRQLPYAFLMQWAVLTLLFSIATEAVLGTIFRFAAVRIASMADLDYILDATGPSFFTVWGMHMGAYLGGAVGVVTAVVIILRKKRRLPPGLPTQEMSGTIGQE